MQSHLSNANPETSLLEHLLQGVPGKVDSVDALVEVGLHFAKVGALQAVTKQC